jgi:hypothetical protein
VLVTKGNNILQQPSQFIILTNISKLIQKNFFIPRKIYK